MKIRYLFPALAFLLAVGLSFTTRGNSTLQTGSVSYNNGTPHCDPASSPGCATTFTGAACTVTINSVLYTFYNDANCTVPKFYKP